MQAYMGAKARIFGGQGKEDVLLLKKRNRFTSYFLDRKPKAKVIFYDKEKISTPVAEKFSKKWGKHNLDNLKAAIQAAKAVGISGPKIKAIIGRLSLPALRQEIIFKSADLTIVNDSNATTPEATIAAIDRFYRANRPIILISGGTDKKLDFRQWGSIIEEKVARQNLVLLEGSATKKMVSSLPRDWQPGIRVKKTLGGCFSQALSRTKKLERAIVLFSPGATSFEKFDNEFTRGDRFNKIVKATLRKGR